MKQDPLMTMLIVDDEIVLLQSLRRGLKSRGYLVLEASNAQEALNLLHNSAIRVDLVITDYAMPGMDGLELLQKIREYHGNLPVIMMTAYGQKELIIDALRNRCDSFIEKPFTLTQLLQEVERTKTHIIQNTNQQQLTKMVPMFVHQLRNPLTSIRGSADLAMVTLDDPETLKQCLTRIVSSTEMINKINKELLQMGLLEQVKTEALDINLILTESLTMFMDLLTIKGVQIEEHLSSSPLYSWGSRFGLEQVFKNLILNSVDAMDDRPHKTLKIKTKAVEEPSAIAISIEDTGCGIQPELMDQIFTPYFTSKAHGTGLGLAVVKSIIEEHDGKIIIETQPEKGTSFTITIPAIDPIIGFGRFLRAEEDSND
jgi:signal transduction histidine kinase